MPKVACIIATKDRPVELGRLLQSIKAQDMHPDEIIIVDASVSTPSYQQSQSGGLIPLRIRHLKAHRACLPAQRNQGIAVLSKEIDFICFLDDDIVLHKGAYGAMADFWKTAPKEVGGAVFNIMNEKKPGGGVFFKRLFCTGTFERGVVLPSGYNTLMCPASETRQVRWLFGGATVWKRKVFDEFLFDDWFESTGLCEDLDFSYRVGERYKLYVVADAQVDHLTGTVTRRRNFWFGRSQIKNRYHFVKKHVELSRALCLWAGLGQFLENIALACLSFSGHYFLRAMGNLRGFYEL